MTFWFTDELSRLALMELMSWSFGTEELWERTRSVCTEEKKCVMYCDSNVGDMTKWRKPSFNRCCRQLNKHRPGIVNLRAPMCIFTHHLSISYCYLLLAAVSHANLQYWQSGCCMCCRCCCFSVTWGCKLNRPAGMDRVVWLIDWLIDWTRTVEAEL